MELRDATKLGEDTGAERLWRVTDRNVRSGFVDKLDRISDGKSRMIQSYLTDDNIRKAVDRIFGLAGVEYDDTRAVLIERGAELLESTRPKDSIPYLILATRVAAMGLMIKEGLLDDAQQYVDALVAKMTLSLGINQGLGLAGHSRFINFVGKDVSIDPAILANELTQKLTRNPILAAIIEMEQTHGYPNVTSVIRRDDAKYGFIVDDIPRFGMPNSHAGKICRGGASWYDAVRVTNAISYGLDLVMPVGDDRVVLMSHADEGSRIYSNMPDPLRSDNAFVDLVEGESSFYSSGKPVAPLVRLVTKKHYGDLNRGSWPLSRQFIPFSVPFSGCKHAGEHFVKTTSCDEEFSFDIPHTLYMCSVAI